MTTYQENLKAAFEEAIRSHNGAFLISDSFQFSNTSTIIPKITSVSTIPPGVYTPTTKDISKPKKMKMPQLEFCLPFGFEMTFIHPKGTDWDFTLPMKRKLKQISKKLGGTYIKDGEDVIEWNTPVFKEFSKLKKYFVSLRREMKKLGFVEDTEDFGGGGMHIHVDIPFNLKNNKSFKKYFITEGKEYLEILFYDFYCRPYLNWIFNEPVDDDNASNYFLVQEEKLSLKTIRQKYSHEFEDSKENGLCYNTGTNCLEFRIFRQAKSVEELYLVCYFLSSYLRFIRNKPFSSTNKKINLTTLKKYRKFDYCVSFFEEFLRNIYISSYFEYYKKYFIDTNLKTRIEYFKELEKEWKKCNKSMFPCSIPPKNNYLS